HAAAESAPNVLRLLGNARIGRGATVVEIGCGSGILARELVEGGYRVAGFDVSPAMIRLAQAKAPRARFRVAALEDVAVPRSGAGLALGEVVTYVRAGMPALADFFGRVHAALAQGGLLIFDFIESARGRTFATKTFHGEAWTMTVNASFDRASRELTRHIAIVMQVGAELSHVSETHAVRIYS